MASSIHASLSLLILLLVCFTSSIFAHSSIPKNITISITNDLHTPPKQVYVFPWPHNPSERGLPVAPGKSLTIKTSVLSSSGVEVQSSRGCTGFDWSRDSKNYNALILEARDDGL